MSTSGSGAVVVGIDGSESALQATRWAAVEARSMQRPLRLVHGSIWPVVHHPTPLRLPLDYHEAMVEEARGWVRRARAAAEEAAPGVAVEEVVRTGAPVPVLLEELEGAYEVVVGSRGLGGFAGLLVGSVAVGLTHHAPCPVVVVRAEGDPTGPVVVGVDGTSASDAAICYAFDAASRAGAPLCALYAWSDVEITEWWVAPTDMVRWEAVEDEQRRALAERLASWQEKYPNVAVEQVVVRDRPAHRLLEQGQRAWLLVVGSRGRGGFTGMLLGSPSRTLV
ncbi:MAG: universal stress protein, partial [Actinomycetota bacterium]|nr:universal stress protein [Actinomycetota bacterium]